MTVHDDSWLELAEIAFRIIEAAPGGDELSVALGGGTMLMARLQHRVSRDLDLFLSDAQLLTSLSPRLNDVAAVYETYEESANHVRIAVGGREIDFIVAPHLTPRPTFVETILGRQVYVETSAEILAKKFFYRGRLLKPRDAFDLAAVAELAPRELPDRPIMAALINHPLKAAIMDRLDELAGNWPIHSGEVTPLPAGAPIVPRAVEITREWMAGI